MKTANETHRVGEYDQVFDGINGIWNAIYHDVKEWQLYYLNRFAGVKYFIAPDYSLAGDVHHIENLHRIFKARSVSIWLTLNLKVPVIPNITYSTTKIFPNMLEGMGDCEIVAFSTKGLMKSADARQLLREAIKFTVDNLKKLKAIIIYTVSIHDETIHDLLSYAEDRGIRLVIPRNTLRDRNIARWEESNGKIHQ